MRLVGLIYRCCDDNCLRSLVLPCRHLQTEAELDDGDNTFPQSQVVSEQLPDRYSVEVELTMR